MHVIIELYGVFVKKYRLGFLEPNAMFVIILLIL